MTNDELETLLSIAQRTQGWNFREWPPQHARLAGGCELIVMPPWLWRRRIGVPRPRTASCGPHATRTNPQYATCNAPTVTKPFQKRFREPFRRWVAE